MESGSKARKLKRLKGFFKFCIKRRWFAESPAADLEAPGGAGRPASLRPFTDIELTRTYDT
jgi:site-specific recombinase XerD